MEQTDGNWFIRTEVALREMNFCYDRFQVTNGTAVQYAANSVWKFTGVLSYTLPSFVLHLVFVNVTFRVFLIFLKFGIFRQPRFIGELLAGILMGPSIFGKLHTTMFRTVFSLDSFRVLETVAGFALTYSMFLTGLETGFTSVRHASAKALSIGILGVILPFTVGCSICWLIDRRLSTGPLFWGAALSMTSFPVVTRVVADLKLIHTEFGQQAMSVANVSDMASWVFIIFAMGVSSGDPLNPWPLVCFLVFVLVCVFGVRPILQKLLAQSDAEGYVYEERHMQYVLMAVTVCSFLSDMIGVASFSGALVLGLVIPSGDFTTEIVERLGDVIDKILLPLFFVVIGLKCNFELFDSNKTAEMSLIWSCIGVACAAKVGSTILAAVLHGMSLKETLTLGIILNTKGIVALVIINEGFERGLLSLKAFQSLVVAAGIMTALVRPIISSIYQPSRTWLEHKRRTLYSMDLEDEDDYEDEELRILVGVFEMRSVPGLINIIELSNPASESPLIVFLLHLVELIGNTATLLIIHNTDKKASSQRKRRLTKRGQLAQSDQIIQAFREFEYETSGQLFIQPFTTMSPYATMDEDICGIALDKKASLIILPYHTHLEGGIKLEEENKLLKQMNDRVLERSPCSIAILVDRGLGSLPQLANLSSGVSRRIVCIFVSGHDDREALFYALRMAAHPRVKLDIIRLMYTDDSELERRMDIDDEEAGRGILDVIADYEKDKHLDIEFLKRFRDKITGRENVSYFEICSNNSEQTLEILKELEGKYELFIVGRGKRSIAPATVGMLDWAENPELGVLGDALLASEFAATSSLLVVQRFFDEETVTTGIALEENVQQERWRNDSLEREVDEEEEDAPKFMGGE